ncbi:hypothetical protein AB0L26_23595 [Streptomyces nondiastaticus]|uniref:hypothetical protein n=1 Tax=Streptomyces nondiastaticus TaxID=3154512 RepID=UPI0034452D9D
MSSQRCASGADGWRGLAGWFEAYPLELAAVEDQQILWERAARNLILQVIDRTGCGSGWYGHCRQVLTWFLSRWGVAPDVAEELVEQAIGGRFRSWTGPAAEDIRTFDGALLDPARAEALLAALEMVRADAARGASLPLTVRAARAYLDVCFFHPFDDGNAWAGRSSPSSSSSPARASH